MFTSEPNRINPVYWSLCYEEQFYLVMALLLLCPNRLRAGAIALLTAAAAVYVSPAWPWRLQGLFLQYWLCFAAGCAAYLWLHEKSARAWAASIAAMVVAMAIATGDPALFLSAGTAGALAALAPYDAALARHRLVAPLMWIGAFSFSLYLVHVPIGGRVTNLLDRIDLPAYVIVPVSTVMSLAAAWLFYQTVEKRTLTARRRPEGLTNRRTAAAAA